MSKTAGAGKGLSRRSVLLGGLALPVLANGFGASLGRAAGPAPALLVAITGIDPATSPEQLAKVTGPLIRPALPSCLVSTHFSRMVLPCNAGPDFAVPAHCPRRISGTT